MKVRIFIYALLILIMVILATGCQGGDADIEIKLAPIHAVQISIAESFPEQIFVHITGGLADSCTAFHNLTTDRTGNTIKIEVTTERLKDAVCAQVYSFFEKNVNLGSDLTSGQTYIVDVNGTIETFEYP